MFAILVLYRGRWVIHRVLLYFVMFPEVDQRVGEAKSSKISGAAQKLGPPCIEACFRPCQIDTVDGRDTNTYSAFTVMSTGVLAYVGYGYSVWLSVALNANPNRK